MNVNPNCVVSRSVQDPQRKAGAVDWRAFAEPGQYRVMCTICGSGERDKTLGLKRQEDGFGVAHCFRCGYVETVVPSRRPHIVSGVIPARRSDVAGNQRPAGLSAWARSMWANCLPIQGVAKDYLLSRHCNIPPAEGDLRWHPNVKHSSSGYEGPALVALVTDVLTGQELSLHRTWITATGKVEQLGKEARMLLAGHKTTRGVVRLWPDKDVSTRLAVGEGIETALSVPGIPAWCVLDACHLARFPVIDRINELFIARDRDGPGERAADQCARRWSEARRLVWVSGQSVGDLNDHARSVAA